MRFFSSPEVGAFRLLLLSFLFTTTSAVRLIESDALEDCSDNNSNLTASLFDIVFTPDNNSVSINAVGNSYIAGLINLSISTTVYGYEILSETLDPCALGIDALCPLAVQPLSFDNVFSNISETFLRRIPGVAYGIPDLDAVVTIDVMAANNPTVVQACVRSRLSNRQTVHQAGVGWATALVAGVGLVTSAFVAGFGHANTASHIAVYTLSLFGYFQAVAIIGLCAVPLPPIVQSWTQDFVWSVGIVKVGFLQRLASWYQISTGGTSDTILQTLGSKSVQVVKRSAEFFNEAHSLSRRSPTDSVVGGEYIVKGIKRVAFRADIESTNVFMTSIIFFSIFVGFTLLFVTLVKLICELGIKRRWIKDTRFQELRDDYHSVLKGIIFRLLLIGYPGMTILCLWEFTQVDSSAEVFLAVIVFFGMSAALILAIFKVTRLARRSEVLHQTAAYTLYAEATVFNTWGLLYIQFRASAYYYVVINLVYTLVKGAFVAFGQNSGITQAVALIIVESATLISAAVIHPWMDKPTNVMNIAICSINFLNSILLLIFTGVFGGPGLIVGVSGVVFFVVNAVFVLILLIFVLIAATYSFIKKNPDSRYKSIIDNRASFIKSQNNLNTELDDLGVSARVEKAGKFNQHSRTNSDRSGNPSDVSPIEPPMPFLNSGDRSGSDLPLMHGAHNRVDSASSNALQSGRASSLQSSSVRPKPSFQSDRPRPSFEVHNNANAWKVGAGYEHT